MDDILLNRKVKEAKLRKAAGKGDTDRVKQLLAEGVNHSAAGGFWLFTPLHIAALNDHHETVSALLTAGADVNARDKEDDTPLHKAATHGHHDCAEVLLQHGADTGIRNKVGLTVEDIVADEDTSDDDEEERIIRSRKDTLKLLREENNEVSERTKEYDPVLVRFYEKKGMTVAKKACPLIEEAAKESGKTVTQVKNFIGNYRKSKGGSKRRPPADTVERTRRITGYHEYYREQLPRKREKRGFSLADANKEIGKSWKILTEEEKDGYNKAAKRRRGEETQVKTWSEVSKKLKQLEKLSEELDDLGVESLVVTLYNGRIRTFGTQKDLAKDERVGGYIENQLKAAELQRKAAQCLTLNRTQRNPSTEDTRGVSNEDLAEAGTSASSGKSPRKKRKKDKGTQSNPQSSATASSSSTSSPLVEATPVGMPHRKTHLSSPPTPGSIQPTPLTQAVTTGGLLNRTASIPAPQNTGPPVHVAIQTTESQTTQQVPPGPGSPYGLPNRITSGTQALFRAPIPFTVNGVPQSIGNPFAVNRVTPSIGNPYVLPDRTTQIPVSPNISTFQTTSSTRGTMTVSTGGFPHTTPQIPTAPRQATPTAQQAPTGVVNTSEQFPFSPLVFAVPHH
ncbi:ankyrin repeat domain-containing protein 6-like [Branchiostoma lanceolatum]|uniref:ankyrin repeat domain-containing protein 6-like n=1 Tax=Branchiostoma lanceolatum TaxID=7740 RepID=UPI0034520997